MCTGMEVLGAVTSLAGMFLGGGGGDSAPTPPPVAAAPPPPPPPAPEPTTDPQDAIDAEASKVRNLKRRQAALKDGLTLLDSSTASTNETKLLGQ